MAGGVIGGGGAQCFMPHGQMSDVHELAQTVRRVDCYAAEGSARRNVDGVGWRGEAELHISKP